MDSRFEGLRQRLEELELHLQVHVAAEKGPETPIKRRSERQALHLPKTAAKLCDQEAPRPPQPRFLSAIAPGKSALKGTPAGDAATVSGLLARLRDEERARVSERAALQLTVQKERQRAQRAEAAARRAEEQRDFRLGEVRHLKAALQRRDDVISGLQDQVRQLEIGAAAAEAVEQAEAERDEVKAAWADSQEAVAAAEAEADAAREAAAQADERAREAVRQRERADKRARRAQDSAERAEAELAEEREARTSLEQAVATLARQAVQRQARLGQLLARGEALGCCGEKESVDSGAGCTRCD